MDTVAMWEGGLVVGSLWRGTQEDHKWLVRIRKVSQGQVSFDVLDAHASMKGTRQRLPVPIFHLNYVLRRLPKRQGGRLLAA